MERPPNGLSNLVAGKRTLLGPVVEVAHVSSPAQVRHRVEKPGAAISIPPPAERHNAPAPSWVHQHGPSDPQRLVVWMGHDDECVPL
jgi:hypothetical protein